MFHHLGQEDKEGTLREVRRVLKPGGSLHLLDFGEPEPGAAGFLTHLLHSSDRLRDNSEGRMISLMSQAGLANPQKIRQGTMLFGLMRVNYYQTMG